MLDLPLAAEGAERIPGMSGLASAARAGPPGRLASVVGRRVLVVEDEPLVAMDVEECLAAARCIVVGPAPSVARALALVAGERLDAALLDANLAGNPIDTVAEALTLRGVPFAFVTGYGREALPACYGVVPVLTKPVASDQIVAMVADLVAAGGG